MPWKEVRDMSSDAIMGLVSPRSFVWRYDE